MPFYKIRTSMTQNGVEKPLKCIIFQDDGGPPLMSIEGGPFSGELFTMADCMNLTVQLCDLVMAMKGVADGSKI